MKKDKKKLKIVRILAFILAALMILGVVVSAALGANGEEIEDEYILRMYYHEDSQAFEVSQTLNYTNTTGHTLECVRFHLYGNAYRRLTTAPFTDDDLAEAYPRGFAPGGVEFVAVTVDGESAEWGVSGDGEEILRVACRLEPGETRQFRFDYYALLPECRGRAGTGELDVRLTCFCPVAAVWDDEAGDFATRSLYALGDSLFAETARYEAEINVPATYVVAGPGEIEEEDLGGNRKLARVRAEVRQLALTMSRRYTVYGDGGVRVYAVDSAGARAALRTAEDALAVFAEWFGPCPTLRVAQSDIVGDSLGYPGLILLRSDLFALKNRRALEWEVVRQVARQYFSGLVGVDPVSSPFLNDSLCEYAALLYFEEKGGEAEYGDRLNELCLSALQMTLPGALTVDAELYQFETRMEYDAVIRSRGCAVLHEMRALMGEDALLSGLALYIDRYRGQTADLAGFIQALDDATGREWGGLLAGQMRSIGEYANRELDRYE